jgi:hypothetical protein
LELSLFGGSFLDFFTFFRVAGSSLDDLLSLDAWLGMDPLDDRDRLLSLDAWLGMDPLDDRDRLLRPSSFELTLSMTLRLDLLSSSSNNMINK